MDFKKLLLFGIAFVTAISISKGQAAYGTQIGCTFYDLQSNSAVRNGLVRKPDGTMAAVWIQNRSGADPQPDVSDRGIGYNYFDGSNWVYLSSLPASPCAEGECDMPHGCASEYVGWPNIVWSDSIDEIVIAHSPLKTTSRPTQGSGAWSGTSLVPIGSFPYGGDTWPRVVADGKYIHLIASSAGGVSPNGVGQPVVYHRSSDGGATWDIQNLLLPGMDDTLIFSIAAGADAYAIDARNGTVAITAGGKGNHWFLWKSTDNGDTNSWVRNTIALFDTTGVTVWKTDGTGEGSTWSFDDAHSVVVDNNGLVHASAGQWVTVVDSMGDPTGFWNPMADNGLFYWNENMAAPLTVGGLVDLPNPNNGDPPDGIPNSGIGNNFPTYYTGITSAPQVSVDMNGNPYIVYSGMVEWTSNTGDISGQSFRDLYLVYSPDGGSTWNKPINIAGKIAGVDDGSSGTGFEEDVFPMTHKMIYTDNLLNIVWQVDGEPGTEFQDGDPTVLNYIMHYSFNVSTDLPPFEQGSPNALIIDTATCGNANGSIRVGSVINTLGVLGTHFGPLTYSIDSGANFQSDPFFDSLSAGIYSIIVKDPTNAIITISVSVIDVGASKLDSIVSTPESAVGANDGTASVYVSGGTPPYTILWSTGDSVTGVTTSTISGLAAGAYSVEVSDAGGCISAGVVIVAGIISLSKDAGVIAIDAPISGCGLSATENVTVKVKNLGTDSISNIPVAYRINGGGSVIDTIFSTILPGDTFTFTFTSTADLSVSATYIFDAWTSLSSDINNFNDSLTGYAVFNNLLVNTFPYFEDFESGAGGWFSEGEMWLPEITSIGNTWAFGTPAKTIINSAASGVNSWVSGGLTGPYPDLERSYVISPCFDFTSLVFPVIELQIWLQLEQDWDGAMLQSSIDSGSSWQNVGAFGDPINWYNIDSLEGFGAHGIKEGWTGNTGGWVTASNDLSGLGGQSSVMLRIVFGSDWGVGEEGIAFDDISIFEKPASDVGVIAFDAPISGCGLTTNDNVMIKVYNFGSVVQSNIPVSYTFNGSAPVNEFITDSIFPGDTIIFTFTAAEDLASTGLYIFDAWTSLAGDANKTNDSLINFQVLNQFIKNVCIYNFGGGNCNFTDNLCTDGNDYGNMTLNTSAPFELITTEIDSIVFNLYYSECASTTNFTFYFNNDSIGSYTETLVECSCVPSTYPTTILITDSATLSGAYNCGLLNTLGVQHDGDNMAIGGYIATIYADCETTAANDVGVVAINAPLNVCRLTASENVSISIANFGTAAQSNIPVFYNVNGGSAINETFSDTINPGDTVIYTFITTTNLSAPGTYTFDAWTALGTDSKICNDTIKNYMVSYSVVNTFPYVEDFETFTPGIPGTIQNGWKNAQGVDFEWYVNTDSTPSIGTGPLGDHTTGTGIYMYTEASSPNNPNKTASLLSPCIDLSSINYPAMEFWYHMYGANMGNLYVDIYSAGVWSTVDTIIGQQQTAGTDPWLKKTVDLSAFTDIIQVRFRGITGATYESDISIDDIKIFEQLVKDAGIIAFEGPVSGCGLSATENVTVKVKNLGTDSISTIPVAYRINGGGAVIDTIFSTVLPGDTFTFTFTTTANLFATGNYVFDTWTNLTTDVDNFNDSITNYSIDNLTAAVVDLGNDTAVCDNLILDAKNSGSSYSWSTGDTTQTIMVTVTDTFIVEVTAPGCAPVYDTISVTVNSSPVVNLGNDTTVCGFIVLDAGNAGSAFLWNDSSVSQTLTVASIGIYWVDVTNASGCTSRDSVIITVNPNPFVNLGNDTTLCGNFTLDAGNTGAMYNWSTAETIKTIVAGGTGVYWVDVTNASGCTIRDSINLTINTNPIVNLGNDTTVCDSLTLDAGNTGATYNWSSGNSIQTITTTSTGNYWVWVDVTNDSGCTVRDSINITINTIPIVNLGNDTTVCGNLTLDAGNTGAAFNWSTADTTQTIVADSSGIYWVDVTNAGICTTRDSIILIVNSFSVVNLGNDTIVCGNFTLDAGNTGATYNWSTADTTQTILADSTDIYWVDVTNVSGCTTRDSIDLTINTIPNVNLGNDTTVCGSYILDAGNTGATYDWSGGDSTQTITVISSNIYWVDVTNAGICTTRDSIILIVNSFSVVNLGSDTNVCVIHNLDAGNPGSTFNWSSAETTQTIAVSSSGIYWVDVTNANGCTTRDSISITINAAPMANITLGGSTVICSGDSVELVSDAATIYNWLFNGISTGAITINYFASVEGDYQVVVINAAGCVDTSAIETVIVSIPVITVTPSPGVVCGTGDSVLLTASGASTYIWSPSATLSSNTGTSVFAFPSTNTIYTVTGTNATGCIDSTTVTVQLSVGSPVPSFTADTTSGCGDITVTFINTSTDATGYSWSFSGGTTADTTVQNPVVTYNTIGSYDVSLTAYGCGATDSAITIAGFISVNAGPVGNITPGGSTIICSGDSVVLISDVAASYEWLFNGVSTGASGINYFVSAEGNYQVIVTDVVGCVDTSGIETVTFSIPAIAVTPSPGVVCGSGDSVMLTASGALSYTWSPADSLSSTSDPAVYANPTSITTYTVMGTDSIGCIDSTTVTVEISTGFPVANFTSDITSGCGSFAVSFNNTSSNAIGFSWNLPGGSTADTTIQNPVVSYSITGAYDVTLTAYGCGGVDSTITVSSYITVNPLSSANITASGITSFCFGDSVELVADTATTYDWLLNGVSTGQTNINVIVNTPGDYQVVVTNTFGCADTSATETVTVYNDVTGTVFTTDETVFGANDGTAWVVISGGTPPYSISWSPGAATNDTIINLSPGTYIVTITDSNGCTFTGSDSVAAGAVGITTPIYFAGSIKLYPNPTTGILNVDINAELEVTTITIYNIIGIMISKHENITYQSNANGVNNYHYEIDLSGEPAGTYFVRIQTSDRVITRKVDLNK